jgi:hypothetical protein
MANSAIRETYIHEEAEIRLNLENACYHYLRKRTDKVKDSLVLERPRRKATISA